jgi:hypothetical protein
MTTHKKKHDKIVKEARKQAESSKGMSVVKDIQTETAEDEIDLSTAKDVTGKTDEKALLEQQATERKFKYRVIEGKLITVLMDGNGYYIAIDSIDIKNLLRVSYNVVMNQLNLVIPESKGEIYNFDKPLRGLDGRPTGGKRMEIAGEHKHLIVTIEDTETIKLILKAWFGVKELTEDVFEGFREHKRATEKLAEAARLANEAAQKTEHETTGKPMGLVDEHGNLIKS